MPLPDLESRTEMLFSKSDEVLGDTITVVPPSASPITLKAQVNHRDKTRVLDFAAATAQDIVIDLDQALVPGKPTSAWRVILPRIPGKAFSPREANRDESGFRWEFGLKEEPNG